MIYIRILFFFIGLVIFSLGIAFLIQVQHLGLHPWDVLNVGMYKRFGLSIGTWTIIIGFVMIGVSLILDKSYVKVGTFLNALVIGVFVDIFLASGWLPVATHGWTDFIILIVGIGLMGLGGGVYNAANIGAGPRDGFMLSISDKTGFSIRSVRIVIETIALVIGYFIGGPVFVFTFLITFIQSPIFQFCYLWCIKLVEKIDQHLQLRKSYPTS